MFGKKAKRQVEQSSKAKLNFLLPTSCGLSQMVKILTHKDYDSLVDQMNQFSDGTVVINTSVNPSFGSQTSLARLQAGKGLGRAHWVGMLVYVIPSPVNFKLTENVFLTQKLHIIETGSYEELGSAINLFAQSHEVSDINIRLTENGCWAFLLYLVEMDFPIINIRSNLTTKTVCFIDKTPSALEKTVNQFAATAYLRSVSVRHLADAWMARVGYLDQIRHV